MTRDGYLGFHQRDSVTPQAVHVVNTQVVFLAPVAVLSSIKLCACSPCAGERRLCPTSVTRSWEITIFTGKRCTGHGHKREVCAQALGVFLRLEAGCGLCKQHRLCLGPATCAGLKVPPEAPELSLQQACRQR